MINTNKYKPLADLAVVPLKNLVLINTSGANEVAAFPYDAFKTRRQSMMAYEWLAKILNRSRLDLKSTINFDEFDYTVLCAINDTRREVIQRIRI